MAKRNPISPGAFLDKVLKAKGMNHEDWSFFNDVLQDCVDPDWHMPPIDYYVQKFGTSVRKLKRLGVLRVDREGFVYASPEMRRFRKALARLFIVG